MGPRGGGNFVRKFQCDELKALKILIGKNWILYIRRVLYSAYIVVL